AHARAARDAAPDLHVPPRRALGGLQPHVFDRLRSDGAVDRRLPDQRLDRARVAQGRARRERPVARRHARVVHDLTATGAQLRQRPVRDERAAAARLAAAPRGAAAMRSELARWTRGQETALPSAAPGPWLRLSALLAAGGTVLAVVSGAAGLGTTHRVLAALVAPPLAALLVSAWLAHRTLVPGVLAASALFAAAAAVPGRHVHAALAALALAALLVVAVQSVRGERVRRGSWRDYVTLTKPRIMSLLLVTGFCGMIAGARGWPGTATAASLT